MKYDEGGEMLQMVRLNGVDLGRVAKAYAN